MPMVGDAAAFAWAQEIRSLYLEIGEFITIARKDKYSEKVNFDGVLAIAIKYGIGPKGFPLKRRQLIPLDEGKLL